VGGQFQSNAVAGDGQKPVAWVPAARQKEALELLIAALEPENIDTSDRILEALAAPPSGTHRTQEQFPSEAGEAFSALTAARTLAGLIVEPLAEPQRAARLTLASGNGALTLDALLGRLAAATWGAAPDKSARLSALRRVAQRTVLDAMMDLAARPESSPEVRASVTARLSKLRTELRLKKSIDAATEAHLRLAERDLSEFLDKPEARKARPARVTAPPGRPIG
jgi:hypothetical protein